MELKTKDRITINNLNLNTSKISIDDGRIGVYANYTEYDIKDIKLLKHNGQTIIKNGQLQLQCNKQCNNCPMHETIRFEIYTRPNSFRIEKGHHCTHKNTYSETIETLPISRRKSKIDIELRKAYKDIDEKFNYRRTKYVTDETLKEIINEIDDALTPDMYEHYDEYGHVRIELETIEIRKNDYGYTLWYHGRMGDYGLSSTIYLNSKCDTNIIARKLRERYYPRYRTEIQHNI